MQTITIDIINHKAVRLLHDMELLELIHVRREKQQSEVSINWTSKYKGAMTKQSLAVVDKQLNEFRNEWE